MVLVADAPELLRSPVALPSLRSGGERSANSNRSFVAPELLRSPVALPSLRYGGERSANSNRSFVAPELLRSPVELPSLRSGGERSANSNRSFVAPELLRSPRAGGVGRQDRVPLLAQIVIGIGMCVSLLLAAGCSSAKAPERDVFVTTKVVATTNILADFVRAVGGERVEVKTLIKLGADPHSYTPNESEVQSLGDADLIVRNGAGLEPWLEDAIVSSATRAKVVDASIGIALLHETAGAIDPHIWMNPRNAKVMVHSIEQALRRADPKHADSYVGGEEAYNVALDELDRGAKEQFARVSNKTLITTSHGLRYFADAYGLQLVTDVLPKPSQKQELSAAVLHRLLQKLNASKVAAVFPELPLPPRTSEAFATLDATVQIIIASQQLYVDTLGPESSTGQRYASMMVHDASVIANGLEKL